MHIGAFQDSVLITEFINNYIDINEMLNEHNLNLEVFINSLLENEKLAVIPGKAFGLNNYIRVSYATSMEAIKEGLNRIESFIKKLN